MVIADWGCANVGKDWAEEEEDVKKKFDGGTPVYAGPNTFNGLISSKDLFSFGRLAMELMLDKQGKESKFCFVFLLTYFESL